MKSLKVFAVVVFVLTTVLMAKNITMDNFVSKMDDSETITKSNELYASYLSECNCKVTDVILMNVVKQKILYPESNFESLVNPLQKIAKDSNNDELVRYARTAYFLISTNVEITIDLEHLYTQNVEEFFNFVDNQVPENLAILTYL